MKFGILGGGSWGTALAILWSRHGHHVDLWVRDPQAAEAYQEARRNTRYLPEIDFPEQLYIHNNLEATIAANDLLFMAVPLQAYRNFLTHVKPLLQDKHQLVLLSKGIEIDTHLLPSQIVTDVLGDSWTDRTFALSGPSFAAEVARDMPTTVVLTGSVKERVVELQHELKCPTFRTYRNLDVLGVEVCGALKNVIAIAAGMVTGMNLGLNTLAGLITRGLAEITRLGVTMGARRDTFAGLAGIGDLMLTCNGKLSRNLRVGMALAQGHSLETILRDLGMVAEGVHTARAAKQLSSNLDVELPISDVVYSILYEGMTPKEGLHKLMNRELKNELRLHPKGQEIPSDSDDSH